MRRLAVCLLLLWPFLGISQQDTSVWNHASDFPTAEYVFHYPAEWTHVTQVDLSSKDQEFTFSGIGIPAIYKQFPLIAKCEITRMGDMSVREAEEFVVNGILSIPDRTYDAANTYRTDSVQLMSGEQGKVISAHYYRRHNGFYYSRYSMVVYHTKRKTCYLISCFFQYKDPSYSVERACGLETYAMSIFRKLDLR